MLSGSQRRSKFDKSMKSKKNNKKQKLKSKNSNNQVNKYLKHNKGKNNIPKSARNMGFQRASSYQQAVSRVNEVYGKNNKNNKNIIISENGNELRTFVDEPQREIKSRRNRNRGNNKNNSNEPPPKRLRIDNEDEYINRKNEYKDNGMFDYDMDSQYTLEEMDNCQLIQTMPGMQQDNNDNKLQYDQWKQKQKKIYYNEEKVDKVVGRFPIKKFIGEDKEQKEQKDEKEQIEDKWGYKMIKEKSYIEFKNYLDGYRDVKCYEIYRMLQKILRYEDYTSPYIVLNPVNINYKIRYNDLR